MANKKSKSSIAAVVFKNGIIVGYLSSQDEENGRDIELDLKGYTIMPLEAPLP